MIPLSLDVIRLRIDPQDPRIATIMISTELPTLYSLSEVQRIRCTLLGLSVFSQQQRLLLHLKLSVSIVNCGVFQAGSLAINRQHCVKRTAMGYAISLNHHDHIDT